jgi:sec-independent protein translocase protein TatA
MLRPEPLDIVIILVVGLLLFGANRLPETARALGQAMREFRNAVIDKPSASSGDKPDDKPTKTV